MVNIVDQRMPFRNNDQDIRTFIDLIRKDPTFANFISRPLLLRPSRLRFYTSMSAYHYAVQMCFIEEAHACYFQQTPSSTEPLEQRLVDIIMYHVVFSPAEVANLTASARLRVNIDPRTDMAGASSGRWQTRQGLAILRGNLVGQHQAAPSASNAAMPRMNSTLLFYVRQVISPLLCVFGFFLLHAQRRPIQLEMVEWAAIFTAQCAFYDFDVLKYGILDLLVIFSATSLARRGHHATFS